MSAAAPAVIPTCRRAAALAARLTRRPGGNRQTSSALRIGIARCGATARWRLSDRRSVPWKRPSSAVRLTPPAIRRLIGSSSACCAEGAARGLGWTREAMLTPRRCSDSTTAARSTRLRVIRSGAVTVRVSPRCPQHGNRAPRCRGNPALRRSAHLVAALDTSSGRGYRATGSAWLRDNGSETNTSAAATNKAPM